MSDEYDSPWKEILDLYFRQFMAFFFPDAHDDIDWVRGYETLEQELRQLTRDAEMEFRAPISAGDAVRLASAAHGDARAVWLVGGGDAERSFATGVLHAPQG